MQRIKINTVAQLSDYPTGTLIGIHDIWEEYRLGRYSDQVDPVANPYSTEIYLIDDTGNELSYREEIGPYLSMRDAYYQGDIYSLPQPPSCYVIFITQDLIDTYSLYIISAPRITLSNSYRFSIFKRDGYKCCICGKKALDGIELEIDHKHPISRGGNNGSSNLWTLCHVCNRGKHNKLLL